MSAKTAMVNLACGAGLAGLALRLRRSSPLILMYHGVTGSAHDGTLRNWDEKHCPIGTFTRHLRTLKRTRKVIPLEEMVSQLRSGGDLVNTVAITFDDGYQNNVLQAAPALAEFGLPATFFLCTGLIGERRAMWTDRVEMMLDKTTRKSVDFAPAGRELPLASMQDKRAAVGIIKGALKKAPHAGLQASLDELSARLETPQEEPDGDYAFMNWDQARSLASAGFEVGAHTVNHPILSRLPLDQAKQEILLSRDRVAAELGSCSRVFCYPNGAPSDYTADIMAFCSGHFDAAVSTSRGAAVGGELYQLKRLGAPGTVSAVPYMEWVLLREH